MFTVDSIPAQYFEAREADEAVKRQAYLQKQQAALAAALAAKQASSTLAPNAQVLQRTRPESSGIFGNILHGFARSMPNSAPGSGTSTPVYHTPLPTPQKTMTQAEIEALIAEKRKDIDKCSVPAWY